jgi:hypothetical protein
MARPIKRIQPSTNGKGPLNGATPPKAPRAAPVRDPYSDHDILLVNGPIGDDLFNEIFAVVARERKGKKVVLCLTTYGGEANAAFRIGRLMQSSYEDFIAFAPSMCKSAGTLIVTGANKLLMSDLGEIGPLDVQLMQRDELGARKSGLTYRSALEDLRDHSFEMFQSFMLSIKAGSRGAISFRLAAEIASNMTIGLLSNVYQQINPEVLGTDFRDLSVANKYGEQLNERFQNVKDGMLDCLVREYPAHDFVIDRAEAIKLFNRVEKPSDKLYRLVLEEGRSMFSPKTSKPLVKMAHIAPAAEKRSEGGDNVEDTDVPSEPLSEIGEGATDGAAR